MYSCANVSFSSGPKLARVGDQVHDLVVLVVDADDLLLQHVEQDLHDAFVRPQQPERGQQLLIGLALVGQIVAFEVGDEVLVQRVRVEELQRDVAFGLQAAQLADLLLDALQQRPIRPG